MRKLPKIILFLLGILIIVVLGVVVHYQFTFQPQERGLNSLSFTLESLFSNPIQFSQMYYNEAFLITSQDSVSEENIFTTTLTDEDILERIQFELTDDDYLAENPLISIDVKDIDKEVEALGYTTNTSISGLDAPLIYSYIACSNVFVFESENYNFIKETHSIFNEVEIGDLVEARCSSTDCSELTGNCILVKR